MLHIFTEIFAKSKNVKPTFVILNSVVFHFFLVKILVHTRCAIITLIRKRIIKTFAQFCFNLSLYIGLHEFYTSVHKTNSVIAFLQDN